MASCADAASKLEDAGKEAGKDAKKAVQRPLEQAQDTWQHSKASAESGAENAGQDLQEWGEDTSSKPDPLGTRPLNMGVSTDPVSKLWRIWSGVALPCYAHISCLPWHKGSREVHLLLHSARASHSSTRHCMLLSPAGGR